MPKPLTGRYGPHTPLPNPVMEEPIRHILGLTQNKLQDIIAGKEQLNGVTNHKL